MYSALYFLHPLVYLSLFIALSFAAIPTQGNCNTCLPNPIATTYPHNVTGTINATTSVLLVPIPYARSLLPSRFANSILTHAYTRFNIPRSTYPIVIEATIDHDIRFNNSAVVPDFSSIRFTFPFIDLLGDGYSNFRYTGYIYLSADSPIAINGSEGYGETALPASFDPPNAPYKAARYGTHISFAVYANGSAVHRQHQYQPMHNQLVATTEFRDMTDISPVPLAFYKNVTNQPMFGNNTAVCDNMISLWNTTISTGAYAPQGIVGDVVVGPPLVPRKQIFRGARGIRAQRAFVENNYLPCGTLKGYSGTGIGDSG
ncbi:MAG: hypothetical protein L6R39_005523 [Caloplaca ligustica]|nr:MAG: hypothetical protein L6R39_005523 [Caloplaca ligustica]